jgi:Ca2+-binding RTX toxin-like protein
MSARRGSVAVVACAVAGALVLAPPALSAATWAETGSLNTARAGHTASLLADGEVLVAGGADAATSAELYDPTQGSWTATGSLNTPRNFHTQTALSDGTVLVAGGLVSNSTASAELYDPATGDWTGTGSLNTARYNHTATLLSDGKVLVAGGVGLSGELASAELYDPTTGSWTPTGSMTVPRVDHTATLLPNGKVLVAGGCCGSGEPATAELYDPSTGSWTATAGPPETARFNHTATLLSDGKVLVAGGFGEGILPATLASAELYDPATDSWSATGSLNTARAQHTATLLPSGQVLVAGGQPTNVTSAMSSAELYDPATGSWTATDSMNFAREDHTASLLDSGQVLVAGGLGSNAFLASAELFPSTPPDSTSTAVSCSPNSVAVGQPSTCTATVTDRASSGQSTPTGTVKFESSGAGSFSANQCTLSGSGNSAHCSVTYTPSAAGTGSHTITAGYGGDPTHAASTGNETLTVQHRSTSTSVNCSPGTVPLATPSICTATVTDTSAGTASTPTGTVSLASSGAGSFSGSPCTLSETGSGVAGCSVTYTPSATGSQTITADYGGDATHDSSSGSQRVTVIVAPDAPTITSLADGDGQVSVSFTDANPGTSPITSHEVTAIDLSDPTAPPQTAKGPGSPITVKGLTNGDTYVFTVTATSADGTSPPSAPSGRLNVGVPAVIQSGPADGVVGQPYSSRFVITGAPSSTVAQLSGELPPGLTLSSDGALTGTPTTAGSYPFTVRADNHVGIDEASVTVTIAPGAACAGGAATIVGTTVANRLAGTPGSDVILGGTGRDRILAGSGRDLVCAGRGNDRVLGGPGNDRLLGQAGNDILFGGRGRDLLRGGTGNDGLSGGTGNDHLSGASGNDRLSGGAGNDRLSGGSDNDRLNPGVGRDRVAAGPGNDRIFSRDSQPDLIDCGRGHDVAIVDAVDRTRRCETILRA